MKENKNNKTLTFDEALQNPALAHVKDALQHLQHAPASQLIPKKHALVLTLTVERKVLKLHKENPNMPIKKVITTVFEPLTDDIPAPLMLKLTQTIIDMWAKLSSTVYQDNAVAA